MVLVYDSWTKGTKKLTPEPRLVDAIFAMYGASGPWEPLHSTGVANWVYATESCVLRVATDHPEGVTDARTESVAAPVASAAGILTPTLLAFDDSRSMVDRPFSLWERVHGETLGLVEFDLHKMAEMWYQVGREQFKLHDRVKDCCDPKSYLDRPRRQFDLDSVLGRLVDLQRIDRHMCGEITQLAQGLERYVSVDIDECFLHGDLHAMNVMCSADGALLAIIDWGDAGWGDPTLDFAEVPLDALPHALRGYQVDGQSVLGEYPEARFVWDKLFLALKEAANPGRPIALTAFRRFLGSNLR